MSVFYITKDGMDKLQEEVRYLRNVRRKEVAKAIWRPRLLKWKISWRMRE